MKLERDRKKPVDEYPELEETTLEDLENEREVKIWKEENTSDFYIKPGKPLEFE